MTCFLEGRLFSRLLRILCLTVALFVVSCSLAIKPLAVGITELSACKGWSDAGKPVGVSNVFQPEVDRIYACGYLMTNQPISFQLLWYYEDELVLRQTGRYGEGYFYSYMDSTEESFPVGNYRIEAVVGKMVVQSTEFRVEESSATSE